MSAFVVSKGHIDYLVSGALAYARRDGLRYGCMEIGHHTANMLGADLLRENIASVAYRYGESEDNLDALPGPIDMTPPHLYRYTMPRRAVLAIPLLKAIGCFEYQACEHPDWADSKAKRFCESLRQCAITRLPGYEEAEWEIAS